MAGMLNMSDVIADEGQILKIGWKTREDIAGEMCKEVRATWFLWKCLDGWNGSEEHQSPYTNSGCSDGGAFLKLELGAEVQRQSELLLSRVTAKRWG